MKTNINFTLPLLLCFLVFLSSSDARLQTPLIKNGYHVLVGIHEDVKEDLGIIDNLKEILTQASKRIYNGTQNRAYFRTVSVLLPTTWTYNSIYEDPGKECYGNADVVVKESNKKYGHAPFAKGKYVFLRTSPYK